jgi:hypothetical protein
VHFTGDAEAKKPAAATTACCHKQRQRAPLGLIFLIVRVLVLYIVFTHFVRDAKTNQAAAATASPCKSKFCEAALFITGLDIINVFCQRHVHFLSGM